VGFSGVSVVFLKVPLEFFGFPLIFSSDPWLLNCSPRQFLEEPVSEKTRFR